jgi:hypothetical protein
VLTAPDDVLRFSMANRETQPPTQTTVEAAQERIEDFTDDLGQLLHSARSRAEGWLSQRQEVSKTLVGIRDTAANLLEQLGTAAGTAMNAAANAMQERGVRKRRRAQQPTAASAAARRGPGRPRKSAEPQTQKRRTISPEGRERIAAAQRARWAKVKAGSSDTGTKALSDDIAAPARASTSKAVRRLTRRGEKAGRKKRTFSQETRQRMRRAQLRRWAKARRAAKK